MSTNIHIIYMYISNVFYCSATQTHFHDVLGNEQSNVHFHNLLVIITYGNPNKNYYFQFLLNWTI